MVDDLPIRFRAALMETLREEIHAGPLREAAMAGRLMPWTKALTSASVNACARLGWSASAKGHESRIAAGQQGRVSGIGCDSLCSG